MYASQTFSRTSTPPASDGITCAAIGSRYQVHTEGSCRAAHGSKSDPIRPPTASATTPATYRARRSRGQAPTGKVQAEGQGRFLRPTRGRQRRRHSRRPWSASHRRSKQQRARRSHRKPEHGHRGHLLRVLLHMRATPFSVLLPVRSCCAPGNHTRPQAQAHSLGTARAFPVRSPDRARDLAGRAFCRRRPWMRCVNLSGSLAAASGPGAKNKGRPVASRERRKRRRPISRRRGL